MSKTETEKKKEEEATKIKEEDKEEIFAENYSESKGIESKKYEEEIDESTYSNIEFNKHVLFFSSLPNKESFDEVQIKNTGKTCVYFKWQKNTKPYELQDKKSDGIDRFFCHYSDSKIFPDEEKKFTFSFFSEKNGLFCEDWILATTPPIKNCDLNLKLCGKVHLYIDKYSEGIKDLEKKIEKQSVITSINEFVLDTIQTVKPENPPLPDMKDEKIFKFYFEFYNKEYNVIFSKRAMKDFSDLNDRILKEILGENYDNADENTKFWNSSLDELKEKINKVENEENRLNYLNLFNCILHNSRKINPEDSKIFDFVKNIFLEELENFNETSNEIREEMQMPPYTFDLLTRQELNEADLQKYEAELKKKNDAYSKKAKKKAKNAEEEQNEINEYHQKLSDKVRDNILEKINGISNANNENSLKESVLTSNTFNEDYIDRLLRVKTLKNIKNEGGIDNKFIVCRIDIETYKRNYSDQLDEDGNVIGKKFKNVDFLDTKDTMFDSLNYLLNNGAKAVLLLVDFGPKIGNEMQEFTTNDLVNYIEIATEHPTYFCKNLEELNDYNTKIEEEELKDNCCIIMENINFFQEECGFEKYQEDIINPNGEQENLCLYHKNKFLDQLTGKATIFINDSIYSFDKLTPTIIDVKVPLKVLGLKIEEQLRKIIDFFSIENKEYMLIMGDNENFRINGRSFSSKNEENEEGDVDNTNKNNNNNDMVGETYKLDDFDNETLITNLLILNAVMERFKKVFIFGKLAVHFIQFIRNDYTIFDEKYHVQENLLKLMKYILVRAHLLNIEIILPEDFKILDKEEYQRHLEPMYDADGDLLDYTKEIKQLIKRERVQRKLEKTYTDEDELNENADYIRIKLEDEQIEQLMYYKEKTVTLDRLPYAFDFIREFDEAQGITNPKKIFKTPMEIYSFKENLYDKEIVYPEEIINACEFYKKKEEERLERIKLEEEEKKKKEEEEENKEEEKKEEEKKEDEKKEGEEEGEKKEGEEEEKKEGEEEGEKKEGEEEEKKEETEKPKKKYDPRLYDKEKYELVDFGEKSYQKLTDSISQMNGVMWLGTLSPSKIENLYENYIKILDSINTRKKLLKEKFDIDQATQEKKLNETELKARKQLLNIFLKGKKAYETIKDNFRYVTSGAAQNQLEDLGDDDEGPQEDDEQFNHDMHVLIDYYINDDFELINSILKGKNIPGFYGVNVEKPIVKEEEFDPKCLEDITN